MTSQKSRLLVKEKMNLLELALRKMLKKLSPSHPDLVPGDPGVKVTYCDVGGADGLSPEVEWLAPLLEVVVFEPDPRSEDSTRRSLEQAGVKKVTLVSKAVDEVEGQRTLHLTRKPQCSSFYSPNMKILNEFPVSERFEVEKTLSLDCTTLQSVSSTIDWLKIDTQGSELPILKGLGDRLQHTLGIDVEIEFLEMYRGQPLAVDLFSFLQKTHTLIRLDPVHWRPLSRHAQIDLLMTTQGRTVFANTLWINRRILPESFAPQSSDEVIKTYLILLSHRQFALAEQILTRALQQNKITEAESLTLRGIYRKSSLKRFLIDLFMFAFRLKSKMKNNPFNFDDEI